LTTTEGEPQLTAWVFQVLVQNLSRLINGVGEHWAALNDASYLGVAVDARLDETFHLNGVFSANLLPAVVHFHHLRVVTFNKKVSDQDAVVNEPTTALE
jgi:hypothetical protein